jgi:Flp pilus assembly protein TadG
VVVELVLMLPVLLVFLAALIEFGLILANTKVVALASRNGAKIAAETQTLPFNISTVKNEVNAVLATAGMQACTVILEHNVPTGGTSPLTVIDSPCNCSAPATPTLPVANGGTLYAVRVTVCVELSQLTPDLLTTFGFSTANRTVSESTLYPHEH